MKEISKMSEIEGYFCRTNIVNYDRFATLVHQLDNYSQNFEKNKELELVVRVFKNMKLPLPTGGFGNPIAVALEMNKFKGTLYLIEHQELLNLSLEEVAYSDDLQKTYNIFEVFDFVKEYYDDTLSEIEKELDDNNTNVFLRDKTEKEAFNKIDTILSNLKINKVVKEKV